MAVGLFLPTSLQALTINKPKVAVDDASQLKFTLEIKISDAPSTPSSDSIVDEYNKNFEEQHVNNCLEGLPKVKKLLIRYSMENIL